MTRDELIEIATQVYGECEWHESALLHLELFAQLVAAREREACAKMLEDVPALVKVAQNDMGGCLICGFTPKLAAQAIRARGQQ